MHVAKAIEGTPEQIAAQLTELLPASKNDSATYYTCEAQLALLAVLPAMFSQGMTISEASVCKVLSNPRMLLTLGNKLPDGSVKANLFEWFDRLSTAQSGLHFGHMRELLGGFLAQITASCTLQTATE